MKNGRRFQITCFNIWMAALLVRIESNWYWFLIPTVIYLVAGVCSACQEDKP